MFVMAVFGLLLGSTAMNINKDRDMCMGTFRREDIMQTKAYDDFRGIVDNM